ncbi:MAG: hypothetical protein IJT34_10820, partial [Butyrivibrio sp.]|nr:hypothetical protein [Butyrivibrio sp.]
MADSYTNFQNGANGNAIFYNQGRGASPNFNFMLRVELLFDLPCRKVHSFTKQNEFENIQEGGLNDYVHMHLLWDPDLDLNALLDEYYRLFYGPASKQMRAFWDSAKAAFMKGWEKSPLT